MFIQDINFNFIELDEKEILKIIKNKFVIALDFDGVITSPYKLKTKYLNQFGYNIKEEQCGYDACIKKLKINEKHYVKALFRAFTETPDKLFLEKDFMENFTKIKNLKKTVIFIITNRNDNMLKHLEEYLKYYKIKVDGIIHTKNQNKLCALKKIGAKIFVEDSPFGLSQILIDKKFLRKCCLVLYRNIQNKIEPNPNKKIIEVYNWNDLYEILFKKYRESFNIK